MTKQEFIIEAVLRMISNNTAASYSSLVEEATKLADELFPEKEAKNDDTISALLKEIDRIEEEEKRKESEKLRAEGYSCSAQKGGYGVRLSKVFEKKEIYTIEDLLKVRRTNFNRLQNVGEKSTRLVDLALQNLYGIKSW